MTILSYVECTYFTQSNIGISGRAGAIFVVSQTIRESGKKCTPLIFEKQKDHRHILS